MWGETASKIEKGAENSQQTEKSRKEKIQGGGQSEGGVKTKS